MSMTSDKERNAGEIARTQSQLSRELANQSYPALQRALQEIFSDIGNQRAGTDGVSQAYKKALEEMGANYDQTGRSNAELIRQQARQSGMSFSQDQISSTIGQQQLNLDRDRFVATKGLEFQQGGANLQNFNNLLNMLGQGTNASIGISQGFLQNQMGAASMMSGTSPGEGAIGGAASGAGMGATFGPWGALIGGVLGAGAGYLGARG